MLSNLRIPGANFHGESSLTGGRANNISGKNLPHKFRFAETIQTGEGQDDGIVFGLLEFAQARVDVASQRVHVEIHR